MDDIRLDDVDFQELLPGFMREDATDVSLADSISDYFKDMSYSMAVLEKWTDKAIDRMSEAYLDLIAYELNVTWYLYDADIAQKREIIKHARRIHWKLGTVWAIEQVLAIYFTSASVTEWFEYGGTPGHFKISTQYPELYVNDANFIKVLNSVKKYSQILDEVSLSNEVKHTAYAVACTTSTLRNAITDVFSINEVINQDVYGSIGQGGGFAVVTIS
ncbi:MAG: phage tail protein I [Lachnospiraceae bacterium]|nr:phage tail protein I [Lachnospiraceae bacterium]